MSLSERAQVMETRQQGQQATGRLGNEAQTIQGKPRVSLFPATRYGIVDGEIVEVLGQDDIPGMSPVLWCSDINNGAYVPVPFREVRHFATAGQALQALQNQLNYQGKPANRL